MPLQSTSGLETFKHEEAIQEQDGDVRFPIASSNRRDHYDQTTERHTMMPPLKVAAHTHQNPAPSSVLSTDSSQQQDQQDATPHEVPLDTYTKRTDDSTSDPITSKRTLEFIEDLLTPLQTVPMDISYNIVENACDFRAAPQRADDWLVPISREMQKIFDEWLVPMTPEEETEE